MTNQSIKDAFTRFWQHVLLGIDEAKNELNTKVDNKSQVQIITWEETD